MAFFDRVQLLGDVEAGPPGFDHLDHRFEVSIGPLEALDDLGMGGVAVRVRCNIGHGALVSPLGDN